jgi:predicted nucleic acid-binding Zn ribbon protein
MPFCPDCGTQVSEDTRFCPECGRPLAIGQTVKGKSRKKLAGIIVACIIASIVIVVLVTHPPTSKEPEPLIPAHFTTYTDELGLFSISYPPEWELDLESMEEIEQFSQEIISSITSDIPLEEAHFIFMAGLPMEGSNVNIVVEPLPAIMSTHDQMVTAAIESLKLVVSDYHEFSRVKTTIDNRTATIIEFQATMAGLGTFHDVMMCCIVNRTIWAVTCTTLPDEYSKWEDDFDAIVRSLRILK